MIWIFSSDRTSVSSCKDYDDLFRYISDLEKLKFQENRPEPRQIPWSFTYFTPQRVSTIYNNTQSSLLTEIVKEAYEKEVGFIEICQGSFDNSIEFLVTPDLDIEALKKQWCFEYCAAFQYIVLETHSSACNSEQSQRQPATFNLYTTPYQQVISTFQNPPNFLAEDIIEEVDTDLRRTLWRDQLANLTVRKSLTEHSLSAN